MQMFKRSLALLLAVCMVMGYVVTSKPVVAKAETYDPYVYVYAPDLSTIPSHYQDYAKRFAAWSSHQIAPDSEPVWLFNLVNTSELVTDGSAAPSGAYASVFAFCSDLFTGDVAKTRYRRVELENGSFDSSGSNANQAQHLRAVVENSMPYLYNPSVVQEAANAYLGSNTVNNLTGSQLGAAIQAAIWYYSDSDEFVYTHFNPAYYASDNPYFGTADYWNSDYAGLLDDIISHTSPMNISEGYSYPSSSDNIYGVFRYLRDLAPQTARDVLIPQNAISLKQAVVMGSGNNCTMKLTVAITGTIDGDDELVLTAACGSQTKTYQLGQTTTAEKVGSGLYNISFTNVSLEDCTSVDLALSGEQKVTGAYYFEAEPAGGKTAKATSQAMVAYLQSSPSPVQSKTTVKPLEGAVTTELTKVDKRSGEPLAGVVFDLYRKETGGDAFVGTFTTDKNGKISVVVTDADAEYYFVESKPLPGYRAISGAVTGGTVTNDWPAGSLEITKLLNNATSADKTFTFHVTLDLSEADVVENGLSWMTDDYFKDQLTSSQTVSWSVADDHQLTAAITLAAGQKVTIDGIPVGTGYTVEEVLSAADQKLYSVTTKVNGTVQNNAVASGSIESKETVEVTNTEITDNLQYGKLSVNKKLINTTPAEVGETFNFKITIELPTETVNDTIPWIDDAYLLSQITSGEKLDWKADNGKYTATFTVNADETVTINGLAHGTAYTVEELPAEGYEGWYKVTHQIGSNAPVDGNTASGTIAEENALIFTNSVVTTDVNVGKLEVSKKLINTTPAEVGETFNFKITLDLSTADVWDDAAPWVTNEYLMSLVTDMGWTVEDGKYVAAFTVNADETVTISGIAQGATYTVEEIQTEEDRQWFTVTTRIGDEDAVDGNTASGTIAEENAVLFTNSVVTTDVNVGKLEVSKKLINTTPAQVGETFNFKITLDLSTADVWDDAAPWVTNEYLMSLVTDMGWTVEDGKYVAEFTVNADETVTISGIAQGTTYTVEEIQTEEDRLWFTVTTRIGDEDAVDGNTASGTIAEENALIFTNSVVTTGVNVGKLEVSKKLINTTPAQVGETFNFKMTLDLSTADVWDDAAPWVTNEYLMSLVTDMGWTVEDGKYTATFTVNADETVTISGIAQGATYTVEEIQTEEDRQWFTVTTQIGNEDAVDGNTASGTIAEENALIFTNTVVTTDVNVGKLEVSKKLINTTPAQVGETFNFKITLDLSTADVWDDAAPWVTNEYLMSLVTDMGWTVEDGKYVAEFTVNADETVTISGIAQGATYTVEEIQTEEDRLWFTVTTRIGDEDAVDGNTASGTIAEENALIFTNSVVTTDVNVGKLEVSKKLINTTPAQVGETFNFKITLDLSTADVCDDAAPWVTNEYLMSLVTDMGWTVEDGKYVAEFTVNADETVTISGIAQGATYTVEEIQTEEDRQWFTVTTRIGDEDAVDGNTASGTIAEENAVLFTNTVVTTDVNVGKLEVSKKLINTTPAQVGETFNFKMTLDLSTADVWDDAAPWVTNEYLMSLVTDMGWTVEDGKYVAEFTVNADETVTISGIAQGTTYTVEEIQTEEDRQWFTVTTQIGNEDAVDGNTASGTIAEENAVLFTNSVVTTDVNVGKLEVSKKLINTTPAEVGETFNFKITLDLSTADVWDDAAPWVTNEYLMSLVTDMGWTVEDGKYVAEFTVNADETVTISGIAQGTTYTVEEIQTEEDRQWFTVTTQIGNEDAVDGNTASGTIAEENAVLFTNSVVTTDVNVGKLEVSKKLINTTPAEVGETFNFKITLDLSTADVWDDAAPWVTNEYLMSLVTDMGWTVEDGKYVAEFTVNADETVTISGIAQGTTYTVEEIQTEEDRLWFTVTTQIGNEDAVDGNTASGTIAEENALIFTNSVVTTDVNVGKLEVSKKVVNAAPAQEGEVFNFCIVIDFSTAEVWGSNLPWMSNDYLLGLVKGSKELTWVEAEEGVYMATFTLKADEAITIEGLAVGTTYAMREELTEEGRKVYMVTTQITTDGTAANAKPGCVSGGTVAAENAVVYTNEFVKADGPETGDAGIGLPLLLSVITLLGAAALVLNRRRFF